jgi:DNA-binding response OmpR family regulator
MKQILVIDESPLFREYLRHKLSENDDIETAVAVNALDGIAKIRNLIPDLVIMDYQLSRNGCFEVLNSKKMDPNTVKVPVIIIAQRIDQEKILKLVPFNVKKVFTKPVKIDILFATVAELLNITFDIDESPGIVEVHVNDNIIFVEIAQGLNRDKLDLLRYKIIELIDLYDIKIPKVIVMLSDIHLSFADSPNLEKLLKVILKASQARQRFIRILTRDEFVRQFIEGRKEYADIEAVSSLQFAIDGLLADLDPAIEYGEKKAEIIGDKILSAGLAGGAETMHLRFHAESTSKKLDPEAVREAIQNLKFAVVDDDLIIRELIKNTFQKTGAEVRVFSDGGEFLAAEAENFDMVFLDLIMPRVGGFAVLESLRAWKEKPPVIVLSSVTQRDTMIRAFQMGVKSYLVKPLKPDDIFKKAVEILKPNF